MPRTREHRQVTEPSHPRRWLRMLAIVGPAAIFVGILVAATIGKPAAPRPGGRVPAMAAPLLDGSGTLALEDLSGKPVVINFWASWCQPCDEEAPLLKAAYERYGDRVQFLGVNAKDSLTEAKEKWAEWDLGYPSVRDETGKIYSDFGLTGQPETFFVDADGRLVEHVAGPLFEDDLTLLLERLDD